MTKNRNMIKYIIFLLKRGKNTEIKKKKFFPARDVILAYMMKEDFTVDEARRVLEMCINEIDAAMNREKIKKVTHPHQI